MPLPSSAEISLCSLPSAKVVEATGTDVFMPAALPVERHVRPADQRRPYHVGLGRLDLADGGAEIGHVEREELDVGHLAAVVLDVFLHPLGGDLAVVVVGGDDIDLLAPLVHGVGHELLHRLARRRAGAEAVAVAHAAFVLDVVEIQRLEAGQRRADGLARGRRDAGVHHIGIVAGGGLGGVLGIELDGRLRVVVDQLGARAGRRQR